MNPLAFSAVLLLAVGAMAQYRPSYAGSGVNYPRPFGSSSGDSNDDLGNRFGGTGSDLSSGTDAFGHNVQLVEDAAKLPVGQQPFWYLNREHIQTHLGLNPAPVGTVQPVRSVQPVVYVVQPVDGLPIHPVQTVPDLAATVA